MGVTVCVFSSVHDALDQRVFHKECRSFVRAGFHVSLIARHPRAEMLSGVRIIPLVHPGRRISRIFRTGWQIYRKALAEKADVYHFHDPELIGVGLLLRFRGKKVVYDVHEDVPQDLLHKFYLPKWIRYPMSWLARMIEGLAARYLSAVVVVTPSILERFAKHSKDVVMVRNFAVLEEFPAMGETPWNQRDPAVIFLGSMSRNRGIRELVEAIEQVSGSLNPKLRLLGTFSMPELRAELEKLPGWVRTEYLGVTQERERIGEALSRVSAGVVTIHPAPQLMVAYPVKIFEYMAAGIPIIASDFPVWRRLIEEAKCGLLVNPLEPCEIAVAIEYILTHPKEAESMGKNGRRAMETQFNWAHEERALLGLYNQLCASSAQDDRRSRSLDRSEADLPVEGS
jgi:glycosyltransferase involved in cell wall biosynthesis